MRKGPFQHLQNVFSLISDEFFCHMATLPARGKNSEKFSYALRPCERPVNRIRSMVTIHLFICMKRKALSAN